MRYATSIQQMGFVLLENFVIEYIKRMNNFLRNRFPDIRKTIIVISSSYCSKWNPIAKHEDFLATSSFICAKLPNKSEQISKLWKFVKYCRKYSRNTYTSPNLSDPWKQGKMMKNQFLTYLARNGNLADPIIGKSINVRIIKSWHSFYSGQLMDSEQNRFWPFSKVLRSEKNSKSYFN